jgi:hypothetical protein
MSGNVRSSSIAFTFLVNVYWQNILKLLQTYDSNPLNLKELMHQAWLDMIKLNAPTHEFEKSNFGNKQKKRCFQE